jgi:predicted aspartyl protease
MTRSERISRRGFVANAAVLLAAPAWAGRSNSEPAPQLGADGGHGKGENPAIDTQSDSQNRLQIEVLVNSRGPFPFVVDTGADRTVLSDSVASLLGLSVGRQVMVEGIIRTIPADTVHVSNMSFGTVVHEQLNLPVLPRALLGADGYLGLDAIDNHSVTFDFKRHVLKIGGSHAENDSLSWPRMTTVSAQGTSGHLKSFNCRVDGVSAIAFIDTGAQVTIGNSALAGALREVGIRNRERGKIPITGVTGGLLEGRVIAIEKVRLGDLNFLTPVMAIADLQIFDIWGLRDTPALLMGMTFLRTFSEVTVDYGRKEFRFELAELAAAARA